MVERTGNGPDPHDGITHAKARFTRFQTPQPCNASMKRAEQGFSPSPQPTSAIVADRAHNPIGSNAGITLREFGKIGRKPRYDVVKNQNRYPKD
ncbi:hypothetical protein [Thiocystis violacea]|uniref:hypothetical protein n=1 Tax=Thiocystis violacea TaxID=13725 RepID=UPI0019034484|nr:hypothetical protein [Thiocystis violacea]